MLDNRKESSDEGANWFVRFRRFLAEARGELSRVTWPTRREVWATTVVVILVSTLFGVYLYGVDLLLNVILTAIWSRFQG
jgi:preprotein translocase subunit SecE